MHNPWRRWIFVNCYFLCLSMIASLKCKSSPVLIRILGREKAGLGWWYEKTDNFFILWTELRENYKGRDTLCDKSLRHGASSAPLLRQVTRVVCTAAATRLLALILSLRYVARIQTSLNSCDRSQRHNSVTATMIFTCQAICCSNLSWRRVAEICRTVCLSLKGMKNMARSHA